MGAKASKKAAASAAAYQIKPALIEALNREGSSLWEQVCSEDGLDNDDDEGAGQSSHSAQEATLMREARATTYLIRYVHWYPLSSILPVRVNYGHIAEVPAPKNDKLTCIRQCGIILVRLLLQHMTVYACC